MNFAETVAGQSFLNHDFPSLVKSTERIARALEEGYHAAADAGTPRASAYQAWVDAP